MENLAIAVEILNTVIQQKTNTFLHFIGNIIASVKQHVRQDMWMEGRRQCSILSLTWFTEHLPENIHAVAASV